MFKTPWANHFFPCDRGHGSSYRRRKSTGCLSSLTGLGRSSRAGLPEPQAILKHHEGRSQAGEMFHSLGWGCKRERAIMSCQGWMGPAHACMSLPGASLGNALENHCLGLVSRACMQKFMSQTHILQQCSFVLQQQTCWGKCFFHSVPCAELYKTNIDLCSPPGSRGLCSSSCDGRCDWEDALHSHTWSDVVHSGQPGVLNLLVGPIISPLLHFATMVSLIPHSHEEEALMRCSNWLHGRF